MAVRNGSILTRPSSDAVVSNREAARCFLSLNILLSDSRSLKVIQNDTLKQGDYYFIVTVSLSRTVSEILSFQ